MPLRGTPAEYGSLQVRRRRYRERSRSLMAGAPESLGSTVIGLYLAAHAYLKRNSRDQRCEAQGQRDQGGQTANQSREPPSVDTVVTLRRFAYCVDSNHDDPLGSTMRDSLLASCLLASATLGPGWSPCDRSLASPRINLSYWIGRT